MKPGSVMVDLAVERGGNVEGAKAGRGRRGRRRQDRRLHQRRRPRRGSASSLYASNLFNFLETLVDKTNKALAVNWDDELVKATR